MRKATLEDRKLFFCPVVTKQLENNLESRNFYPLNLAPDCNMIGSLILSGPLLSLHLIGKI